MKKITLIALLALTMNSCFLFDLKKGSSANKIGGSSDIAINEVGNSFGPSIWVGNAYVNSSITITSVDGDGVATVKFKADLPVGQPILDNIKAKYKDADGNIDCVGKYKITDEGIMDYNNIDHEPFVLVKYDGKVGDKYTLEKSDGTVMTREIVRKSADDDFYWGGMFIKTMDVEQDSRIPGVDKLVYYTNHKFHIVAVEAKMEDGTSQWMYLNPAKY